MRFALFVGLFLVMGGLSIFADILFRIHLPFLRILFGLTLLYLGISILLRGFNVRQPWLFSDAQSIIFQNTVLMPHADSSTGDEMNVLFSNGDVDLTSIVPKEHDIELKLNVVFGYANVLFDPRISFKVIATAAFAGCRLPSGNRLAFGEQVYQSPGYKEGAPAVILRISTVFAGAEFTQREDPRPARCCVAEADIKQ